MRNNFCSIDHLRNQLWRHKRADLDLAQPRGGGCRDPALLEFGGHELLGILQTVAGPDLADQHIDVTHGVLRGLMAAHRDACAQPTVFRPRRRGCQPAAGSGATTHTCDDNAKE